MVKKFKQCKLKGTVPEPKDFSYFKRFEEDVIENRRSYIVELLNFIALHPDLYKSESFVQFFENGQSPGASPAHMATQSFEDSIEPNDEFDSKIMVESFIKEVAEKAAESQEKSLDERKNDYLKMLTPMASFEDENAADYIYEAALEFSRAVQAEVLSEYQEAYDKYKNGVERLIKGSKGIYGFDSIFMVVFSGFQMMLVVNVLCYAQKFSYFDWTFPYVYFFQAGVVGKQLKRLLWKL